MDGVVMDATATANAATTNNTTTISKYVSPQSSHEDNSGIAFTSARPLEGYAYGVAAVDGPNLDHDQTLDSSLTQTSRKQLSSQISPTKTIPSAAATNSAVSSYNFSSSPPVTLIVGGSESPSRELKPVEFYVHGDLLMGVSPFFKAAFGVRQGTCFNEAETWVMYLPEERPEDVGYLLRWVYWKGVWGERMKLWQGSASASAGSGIDGDGRGSLWDRGGLWHENVDRQVVAFGEWSEMKRLLTRTYGVNEGRDGAGMGGGGSENIKHVVDFKLKRPKPPAFGPLVRLYVLADKYDIRQLKAEICRRVREVARDAKCVPEKGDVEYLWEMCTGEKPEADWGGLKYVVLELYAGLGMKSWRGVFGGGAAKGREEGDSEGEAGGWDEGFMGDLVTRLFARCENLKGRKRRSVKGGK